MPKKHFLSDEENAYFDARALYWQDKLNLHDWRVERGSRKTAAMADVKIYVKDRLACYVTGNFGYQPPTPEKIDATALHEMLHVLLADLMHVMENTEEDVLIRAAEHRVITTIEKLLLE